MKKVLLIVVLSILGLWTASAGLSDWFFCQIRSEEVVISLKKTEWFYKCKDTIASLESLILQTAKDLMTVQTYVNRWRDREYRVLVKKEKIASLEKYQSVRKNIIENMKTFETNLVIKSIHYFVLAITPYKVNIQRSLVKIDAMTWSLPSTLLSYTALLRAQITTIEELSKVETIEELIPLLTKYIYLKKEISWKYE
jgi:hypothetical protein